MMNLDFLREYRNELSIVSYEDAAMQLPNVWKAVFNEKDRSERVSKTVALWEKICGIDMKSTISFMKNNLISVELVRSSIGLSVIYEMKMADDSIDYYEGRIPLKNYGSKNSFWNGLPRSIRSFYAKLHNGFYYYPTGTMGLIPIESVHRMDEFSWDVIKKLDFTPEFTFDTSYIIFESGMSGYIVIDVSEPTAANTIVWYTDKLPIYNKNFWDVADEWTSIGLV